MTENHAEISVSGPASDTIMRSLMSSIGLDAERINDFDVAVTVADDTDLTIDAEGPLAGILVAEMVGAIDWSEYPASRIDTHAVAPAGDESGAGGAESDGSEDDESPHPSGGFKPQVTPLTDYVDVSYVEFPAGDPGRLTENTLHHQAAFDLLAWHDQDERKWVSAKDLAAEEWAALEEHQYQGELSRLFRKKGLVIRRQKPGGGPGRNYEYSPTEQLREEIQRLGEPEV